MSLASLDSYIDDRLSPYADAVAGIVFYSVRVAGADVSLIVVWLILGACFFTGYLGFVNLRGFRHAVRLVTGKVPEPDRAPGEVSHFQALATALAATVGLGNIAGVAVAVSVGGPGATFWMIVAGLLGMSSKFAECTLGVKYRRVNPDGSVSGGPMHYLRHGLADRGLPRLGRFLAIFFAICCIGGSLGGGNMFQVNQAYSQFVSATGGPSSFFADKAWLYGLIVAALVGLVIIGGIRSIARVTSRLVPLMAAVYCTAALLILILNYDRIPWAFGMIVSGAFSPEGVAGGFLGALIQGFRRAAFSNEAGIGSAAIAHSAVKTKEPVTEGYVALLEPFIDTVLICTLTALVIIVTGVIPPPGEVNGVALTSSAFASAFSWFPAVLALAVNLFAFSTLIAWSYYGVKCWTYLLGENRLLELLFKLIFCGFVVIGATMNLESVLEFSDSMIFAMSLANLAGLYILAPVIRATLRDYEARGLSQR